jgi:general secretion pathway protein C
MQLGMRFWRMRLWSKGAVPSISAPFPGKLAAIMQRVFSWQALGAALLGIVLARWTWVLFAPASPAMPPASWEASGDAGRLFGTAIVANAGDLSTVGNIKLIGVFAHRTQGFAVMQVDEKQIGVAQGDEIKPGVRLAETHADHVVIEQGGIRHRVDMSGISAPNGAAEAPPGGMAAGVTAPAYAAPNASLAVTRPIGTSPDGSASPVPSGQIDALQRQLDAADNMPPERREMLKRQLDKMRGTH